MLTKQQEKTIRSLGTKKGRKEAKLCLVEGQKVIETAGDAVSYTFTREETPDFDALVTTETPQDVAGVARIPEWKLKDIIASPTIVVLDGVQDPGNVGTILRLCLGFNAALITIDSADITSPKVVRSSVGALFHVPWIKVPRAEAAQYILDFRRPVYRLERSKKSLEFSSREPEKLFAEDIVLIAGSEGSGISLNVPGTAVAVPHNEKLESLNVATALSIILNSRYSS